MQSHYDELGIEPAASANEIHTAYCFLAQKFHPDMNIGRDEEAKPRFMRVQAAFDVLSDERMKTVYDAGLGAKPIIHIVQQMAAEQESLEPIVISQSFRRKKKSKVVRSSMVSNCVHFCSCLYWISDMAEGAAR
jgi:DnaJ-class molecular chaperone